jgi:hypothetical protein
MEEISYSGGGSRIKRGLPKRFVIFGGLFLIIILLLGSAVFFIMREDSPSEETSTSITLNESEEPSPEPTEEPTLTPEDEELTPTKVPTGASVNKSSIKVAVQNGSGEAGVAGAGAQILRDAGYTISSTGNADNFEYEDVTIQIKNSKKSALAGIEDALSEDYTVGDTSTDLPESSAYDVLVIIGQ